MSDQRSYTELDVWKKSRALVNHVYESTKLFPEKESYGLTSQIRRCSVSIPSNIAEGCGRQHKNESIQFFFISRGSLYELETQLLLAFDQSYISEETLNKLLSEIIECKKLLNGFINYYQTLSIKKSSTNN